MRFEITPFREHIYLVRRRLNSLRCIKRPLSWFGGQSPHLVISRGVMSLSDPDQMERRKSNEILKKEIVCFFLLNANTIKKYKMLKMTPDQSVYLQ